MDNEQINLLVKKLEPFFLGYVAQENRLKNDNGMELLFSRDWKDKTTVRGLHAKHTHKIGISFEKSPEKIFRDIRRRLMADYHTDFFEYKKEKIENDEVKYEQEQKLKALASVVGGEIGHDYGYRTTYGNEFVTSKNVSIYQDYQGRYDFKIVVSYIDAMRLAKYLKESFFVEPSL